MINNATILRIDKPTSITSGGDTVYGTGAPLEVRCLRSAPSFSLSYSLQQAKIDADAVIIILMDDLEPLLPITKCLLIIQGDEEIEPQTLLVQQYKPVIKAGGLSNATIYAKGQ